MHASPELSVIAPAYNEEDNIEPLVREVEGVFASIQAPAELLIVDDGSTDRTADRCIALMDGRPWLRLLRLRRNEGQSAAFLVGIRASRGSMIAMLDADLQNDPADIPRLMAALHESGADWVQGCRAHRCDRNTQTRRFSSSVGRWFRSAVLGDSIRDTGCTCRLFRREVGLKLPLQYRGMHRFMPIYARRLGYTVIEFDVGHRPRASGVAKYGMLNRALPGLRDLFAVRWMFSRLRDVDSVEHTRTEPLQDSPPESPEKINV